MFIFIGVDNVVDIKSETSLGVTSNDGRRSFQCTYDAVFGQVIIIIVLMIVIIVIIIIIIRNQLKLIYMIA